MSQPIHENTEVITLRPTWLLAVKYESELVVYRSVLVKDYSPMYQVVADLLPEYEQVWCRRLEDPAMMFGLAEEAFYVRKRCDRTPLSLATEAV